MTLRHRSRSAIAAVAATMVAAGSVALGASPAAAATDVTIGVLPLTIAGATQYGADYGIFAKNGLNPTLQMYPSGAAQLAAVASNQIQFGYMTAAAAVGARANAGMDIKIVAAADGMSRRDIARAKTDKKFAALVDQAAACASPASGVKSWKDIAGKIVGQPVRGSTSEIGTVAAVERAGGDPKTIKWATVGFPSLMGALKNGQIDVALLGPPLSAQCEAEGNTLIGQPTIEMIPNGGPIMVYVATSKFVAENPATVKAFQKSIYEIARASKKKAEMDKLLVASTKLSKQPIEVVRAAKPPYYFDTITKADLKVFTDQMYKYGYINKPLDASGMLIAQYRP